MVLYVQRVSNHVINRIIIISYYNTINLREKLVNYYFKNLFWG